MSNPPHDPRWPRLLGLAVHEFRTPVTVVAGYLRMLLKDRAGPVTDQQRRLLEEAEKACGRLSALLAEMSDLSNLEAQTATFNRSTVDLHAVLAESITALPEMSDRRIQVSLTTGNGPAIVQGDPVRLKAALTSLLAGLRRELVTSTELVVRERLGEWNGSRASWLAIGDPAEAAALETADVSALTTFDEWRGGCGLSLAVARRVIAQHGGQLWSPASGAKAAAVVVLPHA
jgi:signal transduction histidine kinase